MLAQFMEGRKTDRRTDEQHWLVLERRHDDFVWRADAVDIGWAIRNREVAGIHHSEVNVKSFPELARTPRAGLRPLLPAGVSPAFANAFAAFDVLAAVFVQAADVGFEPRIKNSDSHRLEKLADAIAPAELFLRGARGYKVHRAGQINAGTLKKAIFAAGFALWHGRKLKFQL